MVFDDKKQAMLDRVSLRLLQLLKPDPDWKVAADEIARMLEANNPDLSSPVAFVQSVEPQMMRTLVPQAIKNGFLPMQVTDPLDLVNNLLPSDHHAD